MSSMADDSASSSLSSSPLVRWRDGIICLLIYGVALSMGLVQFVRPLPGSEAAFQIRGAPWSDALLYDRAAVDLLDGLGLQEAFIPTLRGVRTPGYVTWLAAVYHYVGHRPAAARLGQVNMVALVCVIVYLLGALTFSRPVGATAALGLAFYQPVHGFANVLVAEVPLICALALCLLGVLTCEDRPMRAAVAGVWGGISVALKTVGMLPLGCMALYLLWRQRGRAWRQAWRVPLAFGVGAGIVLAPLMGRNWRVLGSPTLAPTANIWFAWACHVHPAAQDSEQAWADAVFAAPEEKRLRAQLQRETRAALRSHPFRTLMRVGGEALVYYGLPLRPGAPLDILGLPLLVAGGLIGLARRLPPSAVLLVLTALALVGGHALTLDNPPRYRLISDWLILLLGVGGLAHWLRLLTGAAPLERSPSPPSLSPAFSALPLGVLCLVAGFMALPAWRMALGSRAPAQATPKTDWAQLFGPSVKDKAVLDEVSPLTFSAYRRYLLQHRGHLTPWEGKVVAWHGVIEPLVVLEAHQDDWRGSLFARRPYKRTIATFRADGAPDEDVGRVWLEIPESVGRFSPNSLTRAWVLARVDTNTQSLLYQRYRLVALAIRPEA